MDKASMTPAKRLAATMKPSAEPDGDESGAMIQQKLASMDAQSLVGIIMALAAQNPDIMAQLQQELGGTAPAPSAAPPAAGPSPGMGMAPGGMR